MTHPVVVAAARQALAASAAPPALLFPASPGWPMDAWRAEAVGAEQAGFVTHRVDVTAAEAGRVHDVAVRVPPGGGTLLFRGPVLSTKGWATLEAALALRGWRLLPSRPAREAAHHVPAAQERLGDLAAPGVAWVDGFFPDVAWARLQGLEGGAIVHDHQSPCSQPAEGMMWVPAGASRDVLDAAIAEVLAQRGDDAVGGLVLRRPVALVDDQRADAPPAERLGRAIVWRGVDLLDSGVTDVPGAPDLAALCDRLGCPFLCVDVALDADGRGVLVGVDDASGAELPDGTDVVAFYKALRDALD